MAAASVIPAAAAAASTPAAAPTATPSPLPSDFLPGVERVATGGDGGGVKLRLKGASLQDLEALVRHLGYDKGEGDAGATARRLFRWMYHKVRGGAVGVRIAPRDLHTDCGGLHTHTK